MSSAANMPDADNPFEVMLRELERTRPDPVEMERLRRGFQHAEREKAAARARLAELLGLPEPRRPAASAGTLARRFGRGRDALVRASKYLARRRATPTASPSRIAVAKLVRMLGLW